MIRLDCNESPMELGPELKQEALNILLNINWNRYPSIDGEPVRAHLAAASGWPIEQVFVGNGSDELLQALFIGLAGLFDTVIIPTPTFGMYKILAERFKKDVKEIAAQGQDFTPSISAIQVAVSDPRSLVFICQPNNPTGRLWTAQEIDEITTASRGIVVVDQAYGEFAGLAPSNRVVQRCVVLHTYSKAFGAAGLRFGYALSSPDLADKLKAGLLPYNLNTFTQALVPYYLTQSGFVEKNVNEVRRNREKLSSTLNDIKGVTALPSQANFILFRVDNAHAIWRELRAEGVYIRCFSEPELNDYLRVTVGLPEENAEFVRVLKHILGRMSS